MSVCTINTPFRLLEFEFRYSLATLGFVCEEHTDDWRNWLQTYRFARHEGERVLTIYLDLCDISQLMPNSIGISEKSYSDQISNVRVTEHDYNNDVPLHERIVVSPEGLHRALHQWGYALPAILARPFKIEAFLA